MTYAPGDRGAPTNPATAGTVSFDITASGVAYAALRRSGERRVRLYRVSLGNGRLRSESRDNAFRVGGRIRGLTAVGRAR